jgi:CheY-like chemotaxis protein
MAAGQTAALKMQPVSAALNCEADATPSLHESHILVVDDDPGVLETVALLLTAAGYKTSAAHNGFDALQKLKAITPSLILCDLDMPDMSGSELLSIIRRRFPEIPVIAMSGMYSGDSVPQGVIADAFYSKGQRTPPALFRIVADVLRRSASYASSHDFGPAPIWGRWIGTDTCGTSYVLVACDECLRSFPVVIDDNTAPGIHDVECIFCGSKLQYISEHDVAERNYMRVMFDLLTKWQTSPPRGAKSDVSEELSPGPR